MSVNVGALGAASNLEVRAEGTCTGSMVETTMINRVFKQFAGLLLILSLLSVGCGSNEPEYNSMSGVDGTRDTAARLYLGTSEDDTCSSTSGDEEDWRYMMVREDGVLRVTVAFDTTQDIDADLLLHDGLGRAIDRIHVNASDTYYEFSALPVTMGRYYLHVVCRSGESVYTVAAEFSRERPETIRPSVVYQIPPEPKKPKRKKRRRRKRKPKPKPAPQPPPQPVVQPTPAPAPAPVVTPTPTPPPPKPEPKPEPKPKKPSANARIILITANPGAPTTVRLKGVNTRKGFFGGETGQVLDTNRQPLSGKTVTLKSCVPNYCDGESNASPAELQGASVRFGD